MAHFLNSRLKIKRFNEHLSDFHDRLVTFSGSDFYAIRIEYDPERREQFICFDIDLGNFPLENCALIIGDAVQNLRSALDLMWYRVMRLCKGTPSRHTKFPIFDAEHDLMNAINRALEKQQIISDVHKLVMQDIRPYKAGNLTLWALNELSIRDKHETLIPVMKIMGFFDVALEDEECRAVGRGNFVMDESSRIKLTYPSGYTNAGKPVTQKITMKNKGRTSANLLLDVGVPAFEGQAVFPTLKKISDEVVRTIDAFDILFATKDP